MFKIEQHKLWTAPDKREWVQCAYAPSSTEPASQNTDQIQLRTSNGVLNALGQSAYYQQSNIKDGAHYIVGEDGEVIQHQVAVQRTNADHPQHTVVVELINPGALHEDAQGVWRTWWGDPVENDWIRCTEDRTGWVCAGKQQLNSAIELIVVLCKYYNIKQINYMDNLVLDHQVEKIINERC